MGELGVDESGSTLELALVAQVDDGAQAEVLDRGASAGRHASWLIRPVEAAGPHPLAADVVQPPASRTLKQPSMSRWPQMSVGADVTGSDYFL